MADNYKDMVGTRKGAYPKLNISGRKYERPVSTCNLGHEKFCVLDHSLSPEARDVILAGLRAYVTPPKRNKAKSESGELNEPT